MLDSETKRRIDTARDILVGKVPDPKSQVEQITIALIYKFMDDMDAESEELGGKRKFFTGEFARYGWAKLMDRSLGGHEMLGLYGEGITKMTENPGLPPLFRDIFKNAYLPYRDPETLKSFLKIIDEFEYDHSERLGDAFEYLLSVLGSQGDAGQFRTPRHIIDFMVEVIDPQKGETILDPACGTAGFLISAYKHILRENTGIATESTKNTKNDFVNSVPFVANNLLTPDEKGRLAQNFKGYDISPDMVRLSLVNLYLHGFTDPHIYEYDTLTSEERWNDFADVILANPPFMSPKGGIKPHKRFTIQAKRSEVLFVDYMAEHLTPTGRAAIIVPEGIIFQSQTAYKQLRKMLVEQSLVAVVSLPAGCFNPYSGVKTSILILDKALARHRDAIAFYKIENDGFGLGAQRRAIEKNDLPAAADFLKQWLSNPPSDIGNDQSEMPSALIIPKAKIAENGDYNLSGERYQTGIAVQTRFPMVPLGEVAELIRGITFGKTEQLERANENSLLVATTKAAQSGGIVEEALYHVPRSLLKDEAKLLRPGDILISTANSLNLLGRTTHIQRVDRPMSFGAFMSLIRHNKRILDGYLIYCLRTAHAAEFFMRNANTTTNISNLNLSALSQFPIPLPPLEIQREIVAEIEGYQKVIDGARAVLDNYRPHIPIHPDWPMHTISDVSIRITKGSSPNWQGINYCEKEDGILFVTSENVGLGQLLLDEPKYVERRFNEIEPKSVLQKGDVLTNIVGASIGRTAIFDLDVIANINQAVCIIRPKADFLDSTYLMTLLNSPTFIQKLLGNSVENARANVSMGVLGSLTIPLPSLETQQAIVTEIEAEQALVAANRELITRMETKIQSVLARIWGEEAPIYNTTSLVETTYGEAQ